MSTLPANVTILDLPAATTLTLAEVIEAVQTSGGVANSVQIPLSQIMTSAFGGLPLGGATGQLLGKQSGTAFASQWVNLSDQLTASTGIALSGSTTVAVSLASTVGLSVLGVTGAAQAVPAAIAGTGAQVLRLNDAGSALAFGAVNLGSTAAVTGVLNVPQGGVGTSTLTQNGILFGNAAATVGITGAGNTALVLISPGPLANPIFGQVSMTAAVTGVLGVPNGGSGTSTLTSKGILFGNAAATVGITGAGNTALVLISPGPLANPIFGQVSMTAAVTGVLGVPNGGTGTSTLTSNAVLLGNAAGTVGLTTVGSNGQLLQSQGGGSAPVWVGGMVLLNTLSPNNVSTINDTTSLTSTYRNYMITFENVCPTQTTTLEMQVATTGTAFISGGYVSMANIDVNATVVTETSTTVLLLSGLRATTIVHTTTTYGLNGFIKVFNPAGTVARKTFIGELSWLTPGASGTTTIALGQIAGYYDGNSNAITALNFLPAAGSLQTGTIRIYGLY